jgi:hypothetical protein
MVLLARDATAGRGSGAAGTLLASSGYDDSTGAADIGLERGASAGEATTTSHTCLGRRSHVTRRYT